MRRFFNAVGLTRLLLLVVATLIALAVYSHAFVSKVCEAARVLLFGPSKTATSTQTAAKQNPNKMLFISCGGFLEESTSTPSAVPLPTPQKTIR